MRRGLGVVAFLKDIRFYFIWACGVLEGFRDCVKCSPPHPRLGQQPAPPWAGGTSPFRWSSLCATSCNDPFYRGVSLSAAPGASRQRVVSGCEVSTRTSVFSGSDWSVKRGSHFNLGFYVKGWLCFVYSLGGSYFGGVTPSVPGFERKKPLRPMWMCSVGTSAGMSGASLWDRWVSDGAAAGAGSSAGAPSHLSGTDTLAVTPAWPRLLERGRDGSSFPPDK